MERRSACDACRRLGWLCGLKGVGRSVEERGALTRERSLEVGAAEGTVGV